MEKLFKTIDVKKRKIWCRIENDIKEFGSVGKIEGRPLVVYECTSCYDLHIEVEESQK